jgi:hypothetical protein
LIQRSFIQRTARRSRKLLKRRFHTPYLLWPCRRGLLVTGISLTVKWYKEAGWLSR